MAYVNYPLYETTVFEDFRIMVENVAEKYPNGIAFSYKNSPKDKDTVKVTYAETRDYIRHMGTELIHMGLRDKHVALIGESSYKWVCSYFCLMAVGAVVVPIDKDLPANEIAGIVNFSDCEYIIYSRHIEDKIREIKDNIKKVKKLICMSKAGIDGAVKLSDIVSRGRERYKNGDNSYYDYRIDRDRLATIVFTSGTTGKGKGVMLSQKNIVSDMTQGMYLFAITPKTMNVLPPHHTFGSTVNFVGHFSQGCEIYISSGLKYIAEEIKEQKPSHLVLVPLFVETLYKKMWQAAEKSGRAQTLRRMIKFSDFLSSASIRGENCSRALDAYGGKLQ